MVMITLMAIVMSFYSHGYDHGLSSVHSHGSSRRYGKGNTSRVVVILVLVAAAAVVVVVVMAVVIIVVVIVMVLKEVVN